MDPSDDPNGARSIRAWLHSLPEGAEIAWSDEAFIGEGFSHLLSGWVDVHVPMAEDELSLHWVWTVDLIGDGRRPNEESEAWVPAEGDALVVRRDEEVIGALACYYDGSLAPLSEDEALYVSPENRDLSWPLLEEEGLAIWLTPLCRLESVSRALEALAAAEGRPDLRFLFKHEMRTPPMLAAVKEIAEEAKEALERGETGRFVTAHFEDAAWMADFLGVSLEEAEEQVRETKEQAAVILAEHDQLVAERQARARALLRRADVRSRLG